MPISIKDIEAARSVVQPHIIRTKLEFSRSCSKWVGSDIFLKLENEQITGSFKIRGATNKIAGLTADEKKRGVIAVSAGNHGQGVALAATTAGIKSHVVMPESSPLVKIAATKSYGAEVVLHGNFYDEAYEHAQKLQKQHNYVFAHPFEDPLVIAGQGTIGLEILEDVPDVDTVIVPIGGGGLISGIATAIKAKNPKCKVYGVVPAHTPGMRTMFKKEDLQKLQTRPTIADGTAVKKPSPTMYSDYISKLVDDVATVEEDEIAQSMVFLLERAKTVVEGAAAMSLAAVAKKAFPLGKKTVLLLCGGNVDLNLMSTTISYGLSKSGRIAQLSVIAPDIPGSLNRLTAILAEHRANVLDVSHNRVRPGLHLRETAIDFVLETFDLDHVEQIKSALSKAGAQIL